MTEVLEEVGKAVLAGTALAASCEMQAPEGHTWGGKGVPPPVEASAAVHSTTRPQLAAFQGESLARIQWGLQGRRHKQPHCSTYLRRDIRQLVQGGFQNDTASEARVLDL